MLDLPVTPDKMLRSRPLVLVVDDGPQNVKVMQGILGPAGYAVIAASDGPMALQMARASVPDLILLDVMMPGMDGYEVCKQLKAIESTRQIPIIFVTARDDFESEARSFSLGAADYLTKPISLPVVLARVKTQLALDRQRRSLEGMFEDVIEFAPDAFVLSDPQGCIVRINRRAEQMFGYAREDLIGRPVAVLLGSRLRGAAQGHGEEPGGSWPPGAPLGESLVCVRRDGGEFPVDISLSPLQTQGGSLVMAAVRDVTERHRADLALAQSRQQLRELVAQNEAAREGERKHMAREVHDELGQILTALRMDMSLLDMRFGAQNPALTDKVKDMKALVDRAIEGVRQVVANLRPTALDVGLGAALENLCSEFARHSGIACVFDCRDEAVVLDEMRAVVVYRIVQESLTNTMRHAQASRVTVTLGRSGSALWLQVQDNGRGFDTSVAEGTKSFGLLGMRERALALGGHVDIASTPGQGVVVLVTIPPDAQMPGQAP